jgi:ubiquinone/menaquinone biosynthesis C-methylase UbiE
MKNESTEKKEDFSKRMIEILNHGALNLAMGIGYRTGLFEVMDTLDSPQTDAYIAEKAGLNTRYVREWLGVMATGEVVEVAEDAQGRFRFFLPKAHGDLLTRRAGNANLGVYTQEIPLLTSCAMEPVVRGFQTGEGVNYDHYPRFQAFMTELANAKHRQVLVDTFLPSIEKGDLINRLKKGIRVCDLGCAEGVAAILMARAFPDSDFMGFDISKEAIRKAKDDAEGLGNLQFLQMDAATLEFSPEYEGYFDYITAFDAIHDQTKPLAALKGVHHMLKIDGIFSMIDIKAESDISGNMEHPMGAFLYTVSLMHCMPVGMVNGGTGLGMMWGRDTAVEMLNEAGFKEVQILDIPDDPFNLHFYCRK